MLKSDVDRADRRCREKFTYEVTPFNLTHWRSHVEAVLADQHWHGPCADLTSTVLDFLTRENAAPLKDCYRLLVSLEGSSKPDHMVGCVRTDDGGFVIVGDTTRAGAYSSHAMMHRSNSFGCLAEAYPEQIWREGVPW